MAIVARFKLARFFYVQHAERESPQLALVFTPERAAWHYDKRFLLSSLGTLPDQRVE